MICLLSLSSVAAGGPVLQGTEYGSLPLYPEQIAASQAARQLPAISAPAALLADSGSGQVLAALNADEARPMASTTKIMTALLVLERANLDDLVTVSPTALVGESSMGLQAGETLTVEDLLWGLLLNSGNDAAAALAEHVAGSQDAFVSLMNQRAAQMGLVHTHFANPHGLDAPDHFSSASDLWRLAETALQYPFFREIVATQTHTAAGHPLVNTNELLGLYEGADGVKTGTSETAGQCLVGSVTRDGHRAMAIVLGSADRNADVEALFDHYYAAYRWAPAPQPAGPSSWVRASDGQPLRVTAPAAPDLFLASWQWPQVRTQVSLQTPLASPGQPAGTVRWYLGNQKLAEAPAVLAGY